MKNASYLINALMAIAIIVLFVLYFSDSDSDSQELDSVADTETGIEQSGNFKVAYVYIDSLLANYKLAQELSEKLLSSKENLEKELSSKGEKLEKKIADFQYQIQKRLITSWDAEEKEKLLTEEQQVFINLQNDMQNRLLRDEQDMNQQVYTTVIDYVNKYNETHGYNLILSQTSGGALLYADDYMNVTLQVLDGLNAAYVASK
ncbi:MAG: OmpH family outer membrane protein [Bacteroidetes bacterium]|jgi:outer membrane protein|nr:OmpH family outer membrane protein [Bacteroidota bacterium]MBT3750825.1 OmpH family outer membrane protein [Bacteroidota bacterium]MBT4398325.1 OmpH family outer membrane protein [Bacteroidota bacterium]MBT4409960.1 OmpH family outer membrane protein [Bacteroidota bacterium]MBT5427700.1 OmpH family outer membrane protein [Bacteroidota bacterium]